MRALAATNLAERALSGARTAKRARFADPGLVSAIGPQQRADPDLDNEVPA
jgi:hypothetical protein